MHKMYDSQTGSELRLKMLEYCRKGLAVNIGNHQENHLYHIFSVTEPPVAVFLDPVDAVIVGRKEDIEELERILDIREPEPGLPFYI